MATHFFIYGLASHCSCTGCCCTAGGVRRCARCQSSRRHTSGTRQHGSDMRIARYTTVRAVPAKQASRPLDVQARIHFPRQTVRSVGDAVQHTLLRTGWTLASERLEAQAQRVLTLPLPDSQRVLGPYSVRTILEVLTGESWRWHEDAVRRTVWFRLAADDTLTAAQSTKKDTVPAPEEAALPLPVPAKQVPLIESIDSAEEVLVVPATDGEAQP